MRMSSQRQSFSGSGLNPTAALRTSTSSGNRAVTTPSTAYDIISGEPVESTVAKTQRLPFSQSLGQAPPQSLRKSTSRQSLLPKPEQPAPVVSQQKYQDDTLALQSRVNKLEYEIRNLEAERSMIALQHEKELREAQARADADYRKYQDAESERLKALRQHEAAQKEIRDIRDRGVNDAAANEKRVRELQSQNAALREENEDLEGRLGDAEREIRRVQVEEVEAKRSQLQAALEETAAELDEMKSRFQTVNARLAEKEQLAEDLERKMLDLNNKVGGGEELEVLRREYTEQMANLRLLENREKEYKTKIRRLEEERRSVHVVTEEKRALELQIQILKEAERRAGELEIQKDILEDEKRTWSTLLEREGGEQEFDTPEAIVRALLSERIEHVQLVERLGIAESESIGKDEAIRALESERNVLKAELEKLKEMNDISGSEPLSASDQFHKRLERQFQLAQKEIGYLRAQLESYNEETSTLDPSAIDAAKTAQIARLESLLSEYKSEIESLHSQIATLQNAPPATPPQPQQLTGSKRPAPSDSEDPESSQLGALSRKNKNLTIALQKTTQQSQLLATELQAARSQLKSLRASTSVRVLELRDNPTAQHAAIKAETLRVLKQENAELMAQLRGGDLNDVKVVPVSSLDALKLDLQAMEGVLADKDKRVRRQREIWTEKAAEFRDVISSILGYRVTFQANGKVKVRSMYYKPTEEDEEGEEEIAEEDREDYIEFDGEKGTMKIGGGRDGPFGREIEEMVNYWVGQEQEIPVFLAAMNMEFYERFKRAEKDAARE